MVRDVHSTSPIEPKGGYMQRGDLGLDTLRAGDGLVVLVQADLARQARLVVAVATVLLEHVQGSGERGQLRKFEAPKVCVDKTKTKSKDDEGKRRTSGNQQKKKNKKQAGSQQVFGSRRTLLPLVAPERVVRALARGPVVVHLSLDRVQSRVTEARA